MSSVLRDEIFEQPAALERLMRLEEAHIAAVARQLGTRQYAGVVIAARGSSDNAARYAQYLFGTSLGLPVALAAPSLHTLYAAPMRYRDMLVIGVSQSGQSPDICSVIADARRDGAATVALTNAAASPLALAAEHQVDLHAGAERSVAATKSYTAQLTALAALVFALADDRAGLASLHRLPDAIDAVLRLEPAVAAAAAAEAAMPACVTLGRGYNYATAWEIALKMKELTYVPTEPYSAADFRHGPIALIARGFPAVLVAPAGATAADLAALTARLAELEAHVIAISDEDAVLRHARHPLRLPVTVDERLSPITAVVVGQCFARQLALARGVDPERPRGLQKVTATR